MVAHSCPLLCRVAGTAPLCSCSHWRWLAAAPDADAPVKVSTDRQWSRGLRWLRAGSSPFPAFSAAFPAVRACLLSNLQPQRELFGRHQQRRRLIRIIDPCPRIPVDRELVAQQGDQRRQAPDERTLPLKALQNQNGDQVRPVLDPRRVLCAPRECFSPLYWLSSLVCPVLTPGRPTRTIHFCQPPVCFVPPPQLQGTRPPLVLGPGGHMCGLATHRQSGFANASPFDATSDNLHRRPVEALNTVWVKALPR